MSKKSKQFQLRIGLGFGLAAIMLITIILIISLERDTTGDIEIGGDTKVTGLVCKDTTLIHPALTDVSTDSYLNTITANFRDDKLSSISLLYEGDYGTVARAEEGKSFAMADYNLILTDKYGESDDIFSVGFTVEGPKMQMVQTARDISKINGNTITYFLLGQGVNISKSLEGLKKQYETIGFTCEKSE